MHFQRDQTGSVAHRRQWRHQALPRQQPRAGGPRAREESRQEEAVRGLCRLPDLHDR